MKNDPGVKLSPAKSCFWTAVFVALSVTMVLREELVCGEVAHAEDVLTDAVPADVSWYLHVDLRSSDSDDGTLSEGVASLATGELAAQFVSLRSRLTGVKFVESFDSELHSELSEERQKERTYWRALLEEPAWWQLFAREFIIAGRVEFGEGRRAWLGAFRVEASERKGILDAFRELLFALASVIPQAEILEATATGADRSLCLYSDLNPGAEFCVGGSGETVLITTSRFLLRQSLQLRSGTSSGLPYSLNRSPNAALDRLKVQSRFLAAVLAGDRKRTPVAS